MKLLNPIALVLFGVVALLVSFGVGQVIADNTGADHRLEELCADYGGDWIADKCWADDETTGPFIIHPEDYPENR